MERCGEANEFTLPGRLPYHPFKDFLLLAAQDSRSLCKRILGISFSLPLSGTKK
jgi:hypothetical protein